MVPQRPIEKRIVLVGGGHSHVTVLRSFGMAPVPGAELVLIAKEVAAPYSGMLPGYVAGHYTEDEVHIDLVRLGHFAGARVIHGEAIGIDRVSKLVSIRGRPPLRYDLLSLDTGITPLMDEIEGASDHAIPVKPVSRFAPRWQELEARALRPDGPRDISVIGTGAAGFELILAIRHRLRAEAPRHGIEPDLFRFTLIGSGGLLRTHNARARRLAAAALEEAGVRLIPDEAAVAIGPAEVRLESGAAVKSDATLLTTKAAPPDWFAETDLPRDQAGFLAVRPTLQLTDDDDVFAVGDCATVLEHPREKAGVFAVRQGPPLTRNLRLRLAGRQAQPFTPQRRFLTLLSTGAKGAIAARGAFAAGGRWAWIWKDLIDRRFMNLFNRLPRMGDAHEGENVMHCAGCAAKLVRRRCAARWIASIQRRRRCVCET